MHLIYNMELDRNSQNSLNYYLIKKRKFDQADGSTLAGVASEIVVSFNNS